MINRIELPAEWLERSSQEASHHLRTAIQGWIDFCKVALEIQASNLWRSKDTPTWADYVRKTWSIDASRIRQYKSALPFAEKLIQVIPDVSVPESDIRKLRKIIEFDNPLMPMVYELAQDVALDLGVAVQRSIFQHALDTLEEENNTGGFVDIGGGRQIHGDIDEARKIAVLKSMDEAKQRLKDRLIGKKRAISLTAKYIGGNKYIVETTEPLPRQFSFNFWKDED